MPKVICRGCNREFKNCVCSSALMDNSTTLTNWKTSTSYPEAMVGDTTINGMDTDELAEIIKSIRNRCDVVLTLLEHCGTDNLIPTVLEDLYQDSQLLIEQYCTEDD